MKETILRHPLKTVSKGTTQRVELNRYLGCRTQLHRHSQTKKMFLCNFELKVPPKASFFFITGLCFQNRYGAPKNAGLFTNVLVMISSGTQVTVPTKSQGTQCTLLKEMFVTSTPCGSDDEPSGSEEEMDADDDPSYVPDPDDERDEDENFADFDDCLYE